MEIDFFKDAAADKAGQPSSVPRAAEQGGSSASAILSWSVNGEASAPHLRAKAIDGDLPNQLGITIAASREGPEEKAAAAAQGTSPTALSVGYPAGSNGGHTSQAGAVDLRVGMTAGKDSALPAPAAVAAKEEAQGSVSKAAAEDLASLSKQELITKVSCGPFLVVLSPGPPCPTLTTQDVGVARVCLHAFFVVLLLPWDLMAQAT